MIKIDNQFKESLEFSNSFGVIFEKSVIINGNNIQYNLSFFEIRKLVLKKDRKFRYNVISFFIFIFSIFHYKYIEGITELYLNFNLLISIITFLFTVFFKEINYKVIVFKRDDFIVIDIMYGCENDAKKIIAKLNKKVYRF